MVGPQWAQHYCPQPHGLLEAETLTALEADARGNSSLASGWQVQETAVLQKNRRCPEASTAWRLLALWPLLLHLVGLMAVAHGRTMLLSWAREPHQQILESPPRGRQGSSSRLALETQLLLAPVG